MANLVVPEMGLEKELTKCVEKSFDFLGDSGKKATYWHLKNEHSVLLEKICEDPSRLTDCLSKIFGPGGKTIELRLIKEICKDGKVCKDVGIEPSSIVTLCDAVRCLKKRSVTRNARKE